MKKDINQLTIGEVAKVEELSGLGLSALGDENGPKAKLLAALAYVFKRRENPKFLWNDAMELSLDEVTEYLGMNEEDDADPLPESEPQPEPAPKKKPAKK